MSAHPFNSNPINSLLNSVNGESITNGWDAVCAISAGKANELFALRFADMLLSGLEKTGLVLSETINTGGGVSITFDNVMLSQPLIQIDPSVEAGQVMLGFLLLAGSIVVTQSDGNDPTGGSFTSLVSLAPAADLQISAVVPLAATSLGVNDGQIIFQIADSSFNVMNDVVWDDATKAAIGQYLSDALASGNFALSFPIATLPVGSQGSLSPVKAVVSTQVESSGSDQGRMLVFMATQYNQAGGDQTTLNIANIIPDGYDTALILSSNSFLQTFADSLQSNLGGGLVFTPQAQSRSLFSLTSSEGTYSFTTQESCWFHTIMDKMIPSTTYFIAWTDVSMPYEGTFTVNFNPNSSSPCGFYELTVGTSWTQAVSWGVTGPDTCSKQYAGGVQNPMGTLTIGPNTGTLLPSLSADGATVLLTWSGQISVGSDGSTNLGDLFATGFNLNDQISQVPGPFQTQLQQALEQGMPAISLFVLENFLFSADRQVQLTDAWTPGDLVAFGSVQMPDWYITSAASQAGPIAVCQASQTLTLMSNGTGIPDSVSWSVSPASFGTVTPNGSSASYKAPDRVATARVVTLSAFDAENPDTNVQFPIVVTPAALSLSPTAAVMTKRDEITFAASSANADGSPFQWQTDQSSLVLTSTIGSMISTSVSRQLNEVTVATVTVTDPESGATGTSLVLLAPFLDGSVDLSPCWQSAMAGSTVTVTADGEVQAWQVFPEESGATVTAAGASGASVTINAAAPENTLLFIVAYADDPQMPSAVAVITVAAATN